MFHIIFKQMIKYSHFCSRKIKTYLNIALEGRLSIFYILFNLQKCLIKERTRGASLFSGIEDISKITGINTACKHMHKW